MAKFDEFGVEFSEDGKTLVKCPREFKGEYIVPDGVTSIGNSAFYNCYDLKGIIFPESLLEIGFRAFYSTAIKTIDIPGGVTCISDQAFRGCEKLENVNIPDTVTGIGEWAFDGCIKVKSITIGKGVQTIGENAFAMSSGIASAIDSITVDPANPNYDSRDNCNAIIEKKTNTLIVGSPKTKIPDEVEHIAAFAFARQKIKRITLPKQLKTIGWCAFGGCSGLSSVDIPNGVTSIGKCAFCDCKKLTTITIPDSVTEIGERAFAGCPALTSIAIGNGVTKIGQYAFYDCAALESVALGEGVTDIGYSAFKECPALLSITIPASVKNIEYQAFEECRALSVVSFCGRIETIRNCFSHCTNLAKIIVPAGTKEHYAKMFAEADMLSLSKKLKEGAPQVVTKTILQDDGDLVFEDDAKTILHSVRATAKQVVVPETVKKISPDAFAECKDLESITIGIGGKSIRSVSRKLLYKCQNLKQVILGESVTSIGVEAFMRDGWHETGNPKLQSITIPNSLKKIGWHAFYCCDNLNEVHIADVAAWCNIEFDGDAANPLGCTTHTTTRLYLGDQVLRDLVIPEGITTIKAGLFFGCVDIKSVTIPNTVTKIEAYAFYGCKGLKTVVIPDSVTEIGEYAFKGIGNIVYSGSANWEKGNKWWGAKSLNEK